MSAILNNENGAKIYSPHVNVSINVILILVDLSFDSYNFSNIPHSIPAGILAVPGVLKMTIGFIKYVFITSCGDDFDFFLDYYVTTGVCDTRFFSQVTLIDQVMFLWVIAQNDITI